MAEPGHRSAEERLLESRPDAPWLPRGSRAEVVLAGPAQDPPEPTCVVRLLVTGDRGLLTRPRADGRGLDLPSSPVDERPVTDCLEGLQTSTLGRRASSRLLGYVRNVVATPDAAYPWPRPEAHFTVWHCAVDDRHEVAGEWLAFEEAAAVLAERHWWPLAAELFSR